MRSPCLWPTLAAVFCALPGCQVLADFGELPPSAAGGAEFKNSEARGGGSPLSSANANGGTLQTSRTSQNTGGSNEATRMSQDMGGTPGSTSASGQGGQSLPLSTLEQGGSGGQITGPTLGGSGQENSSSAVGNGGSPQGGAPSTTTASSQAFRGGPCVASPSPYENPAIEIFARGKRFIHRRRFAAATLSDWSRLNYADASVIDNRSDLDCSYGDDSKAIHIVAAGNSPIGALLYTSGSGDTYAEFQRILLNRGITDDTFSPSPSVFASRWSSAKTFGAIDGSTLYAVQVDTDQPYIHFGWPPKPIISSPDIVVGGSGGMTYEAFAAYTSATALSLQFYLWNGGSNPAWSDAVGDIAAPSGTTYSFSPGICLGEFEGNQRIYLVAVAGDKLWFTRSEKSSARVFEPWIELGNDVATAPDCVITNWHDLNVVALNKQGGVTLYHVPSADTNNDSTVIDVGTDNE